MFLEHRSDIFGEIHEIKLFEINQNTHFGAFI